MTEMESSHKVGWITISTDEYESMKETIEVLSDFDIMKQLIDGKSTIAKSFSELARELDLQILKKKRRKNNNKRERKHGY